IAVESANQTAVIAGPTGSAQFPGTGTLPPGGTNDAFVTRLDRSGSLVYSVYLGGSLSDEAFGVAMDSAGVATVVGSTNSTTFPTFNAFDSTGPSGNFDAFVTRIAANGASLVYSTYLGGGDVDEANAVAVDGTGRACVVGRTQSTNFPTTPSAFSRSRRGT